MGVLDFETSWRFRETAPEHFAAHYQNFCDEQREALLADIARADMLLTADAYRQASEHPYTHLRHEKIICIGRSPGTIGLLGYFHSRGVPPECMTIIDLAADVPPQHALQGYSLKRNRQSGEWHLRGGLLTAKVRADFIILPRERLSIHWPFATQPDSPEAAATDMPVAWAPAIVGLWKRWVRQPLRLPLRVSDGAVRTRTDKYASNLFAVSIDEEMMFDSAPRTMLTIAVRAYANYLRRSAPAYARHTSPAG